MTDQVAVGAQGSFAHHGRVGLDLEQGELSPLERPEAARRAAVPRRGTETGGAGPLEDHVGEEQLLAMTVPGAKVDRPAGFLNCAGLLDAQPAGLLLSDTAVAAAVLAVAEGVVGLPPPAAPAPPVVGAIDAHAGSPGRSRDAVARRHGRRRRDPR